MSDLEYLENLAANEPDAAFEAICEAARDTEASIDENAWKQGDLALLVDKVYGENRIADFAKEINAKVSTVKQRRQMSGFYEKDTRGLFPNLSRSHYRDALKFKDPQAALLFLTQASANGWTVEAAAVEIRKRLGKPVPPILLLDAAARVCKVDKDSGYITLQVKPGVDANQFIHLANEDVRMKLWEAA